MDNKITNETKEAVLNMFKDGESQRKIAEKCGISPRSVGRIINNSNHDNEEIHVKLADIKTLGTSAKTTSKIANPNAKGYVV